MICAWIISFIFGSCTAVIYHLNDTEYSRMPPLFSLDEYEGCMSEEAGMYCVLQLSLHAPPGNTLLRTIHEYSAHSIKHYNHSIIDRGVCVQKTCRNYISKSGITGGLTDSLEACLNDSLHREYGFSARVSTLHYCHRHNEPAVIDAWDWTVLALILALIAINCVGSLYDCFGQKQTGIESRNGTLLLSFSVKRNWEQLIDIGSKDTKTHDLQFIHGSRMIMQLSAMTMHALMGVTMGFVENPHDIEKSFGYTVYYLLYNGMMIVQVFFVISGFLTYFTSLRSREENRITVWDFPKIFLLRLSRLFPALVVTVALTTSWVRHAGSGPLWQLYVTDSLVADCRRYWWHHLLFINNYTQQGKSCLIQTWHLAAEMQVFVVAVGAYLVSRRLLPALLLLSAAAPAAHTMLQDLDAVFITPQFIRTWESRTFWLMHALGHTNLSCFIIGMITATKVEDWQKKGGHLVKSRWWAFMQYLSIAGIPLTMLSGYTFYADSERAALTLRASYNTLVRMTLILMCVLAFFAFVNRTTTPHKSLLEWRGWVVPSRLSYCIFLLHMIFMYMMTGARMQLSFFSFNNVMISTLLMFAMSLLAAVLLHLLVEAPFTTLFKILLKKHVVGSKPHTKDGKNKVL